MFTWRKWQFLMLAGAAVFAAGCVEETTFQIPDYTVLSLPAPEKKSDKLVWSTTAGGFIIFDDPTGVTSTLTFKMDGVFDGVDENVQVRLLDGDDLDQPSFDIRISRTTSSGNPVPDSLNLVLDMANTSVSNCPTQVLVDSAYATGADFSFTFKVDQSAAIPVVSVWLKGDPGSDAATYASSAADCASASASWFTSTESRMAMGADSVTLTLVDF